MQKRSDLQSAVLDLELPSQVTIQLLRMRATG